MCENVRARVRADRRSPSLFTLQSQSDVELSSRASIFSHDAPITALLRCVSASFCALSSAALTLSRRCFNSPSSARRDEEPPGVAGGASAWALTVENDDDFEPRFVPPRFQIITSAHPQSHSLSRQGYQESWPTPCFALEMLTPNLAHTHTHTRGSESTLSMR